MRWRSTENCRFLEKTILDVIGEEFLELFEIRSRLVEQLLDRDKTYEEQHPINIGVRAEKA